MASQKRLSATITVGGAISASLNATFGNIKGKVGEVGSALRKLEGQQRLTSQAIKDFGRQGLAVDGLRQKYTQITNQVDNLRRAHERLNAVQNAQQVNAAKRSALRSEVSGTIGSAAAVALPVGAAVNRAASFERENQLIGNTANMQPAEVKALGKAILQASRDTNQGVVETQGAIGFLVAAGLDAQRAQASIRTIGRTATAAGADINDLASASFTLMDSLKIDPSNLQSALDTLAVAGKEGNVELKDMAKVLPVLGSSFVALKMGGQEAAASMGAALEIARKGAADADEAANNMKNYMAKILAPETIKKAKKEFGLDLAGIMEKATKMGKNPFEASIVAIQRATKGDQQKIGELFGDMQVQNFIRPMLQNWDEYRRIKNKALKESAGTTDTDFDKMMATTAERMKAARVSAQGLGITIGGILSPSVGDAAGKLTVFTDAARGFAEAHPAVVGGAIKVVAALTTLKVASLAGRYAFLSLKGGALQVVGVMAKVRAQLALTAASGTLTSASLMGVSRAAAASTLAMARNPIGLALVAASVAAVELWRHWDLVTAAAKGFINGVGQGLAPVVDTFRAWVATMGPVKPLLDGVGSAVKTVWDYFAGWLEPVKASESALGTATTAGQKFGQLVGGAINFALTPLQALIKGMTWVAVNADKVFAGVGSAVAKARSILPEWAGGTPAAEAKGPTAAPALPSVPQIASAKGSSSSVNTQTNTFHIVAAPGMDERKLADRVIDRLKEQQRRSSSDSMFDRSQ